MANIFQKLIQKRTLKRIPVSSIRKYVSLDTAKTIGFVFNENEPGIEQSLLYIRDVLGKKKIKYSCVGVDMSEEVKGNPIYLSNPFILNVYRKDLNWYELPCKELVQGFLDTDFDILVNLTSSDSHKIFPVDYLVKSAKASMRVGFIVDDKATYDIIIMDDSSSPLHLVQGLFKYLCDIKS